MKKDKTKLGRRDFLRAMGAGAGLAVTATAATTLASTGAVAAESDKEKKKARYDANSAEVKTYYRVNSW